MAGRFSVESVFKAVDRVTAPVTRMQNRVGRFTRSMERGLRRVNRTLNQTARGIRTATGTVVKYGGIAVAAMTTAVGLLVREFSKIEDAEAAFTPILGGAEKARKAVEAINETAASTPFQFETLAKSVNQLLPVMDGNIENTIKTLRMMGDTAGGNAQKLDSITRGFTKAMLKGKVDMEALNMIAEAGVPIFTELADSMGQKVTPEFFKMISAGRVGTQDLINAFEKMTSSGGMFHNGMQIASKTTSGMFSTLKDNISLTAAELGSVLAPTVKELIGDATTVAQRVREWVKANKGAISKDFIAFVESAKLGMKALGRGLEWVKANQDTIITTAKYVGSLVLALKALSVVLGAVNLVMMANPVSLIVAGIVALAGVIAWAISNIDGMAEAFENMNPILRAILSPLELIVRAIKFIKDGFTGGWLNALKTLGAAYGIGGGEDNEDSPAPQRDRRGRLMVSPQERTARTIEENRSSAEVTIRDETGRAEVTKGAFGPGIQLQPSGAP